MHLARGGKCASTRAISVPASTALPAGVTIFEWVSVSSGVTPAVTALIGSSGSAGIASWFRFPKSMFSATNRERRRAQLGEPWSYPAAQDPGDNLKITEQMYNKLCIMRILRSYTRRYRWNLL